MKPSQSTIIFFISSLATIIVSYSFRIYLIFYSNLPEEIAYFQNIESLIISNLIGLIILTGITLVFIYLDNKILNKNNMLFNCVIFLSGMLIVQLIILALRISAIPIQKVNFPLGFGLIEIITFPIAYFSTKFLINRITS